MDDVVFKLADEDVPRDRLALLLEYFSKLSDGREPWRVMYPLAEVLLLLTCATLCSCDDFDEIAAWGQSHLAFLRRFSEFHFGIPSQRWLRDLVNLRGSLGGVSRAGSQRCGPIVTTSSPSTGRPRGAPTINARA